MEHIAYKSKPVTDKKDNNHADICGCGSNADIYTSFRLLYKKWSFPLRLSSINVTKFEFPSNLVNFTEDILNRELLFLCSAAIVNSVSNYAKFSSYVAYLHKWFNIASTACASSKDRFY